jgi:hypothetical protein
MAPRGTARLCDTCDKLVHNLSAMNEAEARALLLRRPDDGLCIRYLYDAGGAIWFGDASSGPVVPARRLARRAAAVVAAATLLAVPALTEACGGAGPSPNPYNYDLPDSGAGTTSTTEEPDGRVAAQATVTPEDARTAMPDEPGDVGALLEDAGVASDAGGPGDAAPPADAPPADAPPE